MDYKKLVVRGISYSHSQKGAYALLLEHPDTELKLPIVVGHYEAQAIAIVLEKSPSPRPLTHDLFANFIEEARYQLESVLIYKMVDGVFFSYLNFVNRILGDSISLDARTSDAVAMAIRFKAPIYTTQEVLTQAGILLDKEPAYQEETPQKSIEELQSELEEAVKNEDFDLALKIQEELKNRNKKID